MPELKLGKLPARPGAAKLRLSTYIDRGALPKPPAEFGHEQLIGSNWGMLGNAKAGDCVWAGGGHEHMLWLIEAGHSLAEVQKMFTEAAAFKNYSNVTGYDPVTGANDNGTDMEAAAKYRRQHGYVDAAGKAHKIGAYVALEPGDLGQLWLASWLFDGVGIGVEFPAQWMDAFNKRNLWDRVSKPKLEGGHYITAVAKRHSHASIVTWGRIQGLTAAGYQQFNDETFAYLTEEKLHNGKSLEGFDLDTLRRDLQKVTAA